MNWTLTADGMIYVPKHRSTVSEDGCSGSARGCSVCLAALAGTSIYVPKHRADVAVP